LMVTSSLVGVLNRIPAQAMNQTDMSPDSQEQYLSSIELFLQRKAYPYEYKALEYLKYFTEGPSDFDVSEHTDVSFPSSLGLSGPMNSSWPIKSFNAQRIGRTPSSTVDNPGLEKWRFKTFGAGGVDSGAVIDDEGNIYFGCRDFRVYSLFSNGTLRWIYKTEQPVYSTPALSVDGTIYITSCDHYLYALYPNGNLKWKFNTGEIVSASPVIASDETIYIGHSQGRVFAINPEGDELWHYDLPNDIYGDPALGLDGTIYIGSWDNCLYAINPNGTLKWYFPTGNHVKGVPSISQDGTIYFGSWDGYLYALYPNGTMRWRCGVGSGSETTPAIAEDGTIYVGGDELYAVYPNGTMRWIFNLGTNRHIFTSCPAIAAEGTIYVGVDVGETTAGEILAVNPDGTERWRKTLSDGWDDSSPTIAADGTVYIGSSGDYYGNGLHAFGAIESNEPPNPPVIQGSTKGETGTEYVYKISSIDPDNNPVQFYVDWGDGTTYDWSYEQASGQRIWLYYTWKNDGTYMIKAKARDVLGSESNWTSMDVTMPYSYEPQFPFIHWLLERFPNAFPLLRYLVGFNQYL
jgi:outer membrane protein assembly factor BamB